MALLSLQSCFLCRCRGFYLTFFLQMRSFCACYMETCIASAFATTVVLKSALQSWQISELDSGKAGERDSLSEPAVLFTVSGRRQGRYLSTLIIALLSFLGKGCPSAYIAHSTVKPEFWETLFGTNIRYVVNSKSAMEDDSALVVR